MARKEICSTPGPRTRRLQARRVRRRRNRPLKFALENKIVDAVLRRVTRGQDLYDAVPTLITDPKELDNTAGSLHCGTLLMSKLVKKYLDGAKDMKIGVTVKGCDVMGLYELAKRQQINLDNLVMIGVNCGGSVSRRSWPGR